MVDAALLEKRAAPRAEVRLTAHCRLGNRYVREAVGDLSEAGLFLRTREPVKEGAPVRVAVALPLSDGPEICTLSGRVARVHKNERGLRDGVGVEFLSEEIGGGDRDVLARFVRRALDEGRAVKLAI